MNVVQLEAFEASLRGTKTLWYLSRNAKPQYPSGFQEQLFTETPPFQKRILILSPKASEAWKLVDRWDVVFTVTNGYDWSLLLTLLQYQQAPEHCLVFFTPDAFPPPAFFQKFVTKPGKTPTLLITDFLQTPLRQLPITFDTIFFPGAQTLDDSATETVQTCLNQMLTTEVLKGLQLKESLKDLKVAGAGLAVSSLESPRRQISLFWYYTSSETQKKEDSLLSQTIQLLLSRGG